MVIPAIRSYAPDLIVIASGLDANAVDPLARQLLHSDSYREMTRIMVELSEELCGGRLAVIHEGGYAEAYVPFCGLSILEALAAKRSVVVDPEIDFFKAQQPNERMVSFHKILIDEMRVALPF
jgi:acetoin utilization deacetylase AcuC-like enzyme